MEAICVFPATGIPPMYILFVFIPRYSLNYEIILPMSFTKPFECQLIGNLFLALFILYLSYKAIEY